MAVPKVSFTVMLAIAALAAPLHAQSIRPGDRLVVRILGGPLPYGDTLIVDDANTVTLERLGPVSLAGWSAASIPDSLRGRYAHYLRDPSVDVKVLRRVLLSGEVRRPDVYYVDLGMTLPDLIAHAGGPTEIANNKVKIRRGDDIMPVDHWQTSQASIGELQSGDQIIMGRRPWILQNILPAVSTAVVVGSLILSLR